MVATTAAGTITTTGDINIDAFTNDASIGAVVTSTNGDVDINALLDYHRGHGKLATLTGYRPSSQYGVLDVDDSGQVKRLEEKPRLAQWINAGFFVFEREAMKYLDGGDEVELERGMLPALANDGQLMMYRHEGYWASMDTFKDAQKLESAWSRGAPWKVWND